MSRRRLLQHTAVGGLSAVGLSAATTVSAAPYEAEYENVVDVVEAGADDTGGEPITPVLEAARDDRALLYFPPGRYYMDSQFRFTGFENVGIVGEDATLVPANYHSFDGPQYRLFRLGTADSPARRLRFEGFSVDQTAPETGIRVIEAYATERLDITDVHVRGQHDSGTWGPLIANVVSADGTGLVENVTAPDGGAWIENTPHSEEGWRGPIGFVANQTAGSLRFKDCVLGGFPNNGLYASDGPGQIVVEGGHYRNSHPASLRIGGTDCRVLSTVVEVDETRPQDTSQRGIQVDHGTMEIRDATVRITSPLPNSHAIAVLNDSSRTRIDGTRVEVSGDRPNSGIVISPNAGETVIGDTEVRHDVPGGYPLWKRGSSDPLTCSHVRVGEATVIDGSNDGVECVENGDPIGDGTDESEGTDEEEPSDDRTDEGTSEDGETSESEDGTEEGTGTEDGTHSDEGREDSTDDACPYET